MNPVTEVTYESLCDQCREINEEMDSRRWKLGDAALLLETHYGDRNLESFARDIGVNQSTIKGYKRVSKFYVPEIRAKLIESNQNLTYSFYRDALRLETLELATEWLAEVSSNGYTADEAARKLTERLGRKTHESAEGTVINFTRKTIEIEIGEDTFKNIRYGDKVTIRASK